jgi:hypothetical protein
VGALLHAGILIPHQPVQGGIAIDLRGASFGAGAAMGRKLSGRVSLVGEAGVGVDVVRYRTESIDNPSLRPTADGLDVQPIVAGRAGVRVDVGVVRVAVDVLLDVHLLRTHYDVLYADGSRAPVLTPSAVQPGASAGVFW